MCRRWRPCRCALRAGHPLFPLLTGSSSKRTYCVGGSVLLMASPYCPLSPGGHPHLHPPHPGEGAPSPGLGQLRQPPRTAASPRQIPEYDPCRVSGGHDRNAVPRPSQSVRGPQKPHFNQVFLVPVQGPPRHAAHPSDTPLTALLFVVTWTRPTLQAQVSSATHLLVQGWLGQAAPKGPGQDHSLWPLLPGCTGHPCDLTDDRGVGGGQAKGQNRLADLGPWDAAAMGL